VFSDVARWVAHGPGSVPVRTNASGRSPSGLRIGSIPAAASISTARGLV
jgi:hypothetical protein